MSLSNTTKNHLRGYNHKRLHKGELVILSKIVADKLPLPSPDIDNLKLFVIANKAKINSACDLISEFVYVADEDVDYIVHVASLFLRWRTAVAYGKAHTLFKCDQDTIIDDISNITNYVDCSVLSEISSVLDNANVLQKVFEDVVSISFNKEV